MESISSEHEVVGMEQPAVGAGAHRVHRAEHQVHQDGAGAVAAASGLVNVHDDALELKVRVPLVGASGFHAVVIGDQPQELRTGLDTAQVGLS